MVPVIWNIGLSANSTDRTSMYFKMQWQNYLSFRFLLIRFHSFPFPGFEIFTSIVTIYENRWLVSSSTHVHHRTRGEDRFLGQHLSWLSRTIKQPFEILWTVVLTILELVAPNATCTDCSKTRIRFAHMCWNGNTFKLMKIAGYSFSCIGRLLSDWMVRSWRVRWSYTVMFHLSSKWTHHSFPETANTLLANRCRNWVFHYKYSIYFSYLYPF